MKYEEFRAIAQSSKEEKMRGDALYRVERHIATRLAWMTCRVYPGIRPNHISVFSLLILLTVFLMSVFSDRLHEWDLTVLFIVQLILLYALSFTDRMDGSIARVKRETTQYGQYLDRAMHVLYAPTLYFAVGYYFFAQGGSIKVFFITLLLGALVQKLLFFEEAQLSLADKIARGILIPSDYSTPIPAHKKRSAFPLRVLAYSVVMVYSWVPFLYGALALISVLSMSLAYTLYVSHVTLSLTLVSYRVFYSYPKKKLFTEEMVRELRASK